MTLLVISVLVVLLMIPSTTVSTIDFTHRIVEPIGGQIAAQGNGSGGANS